MKKEQIAIIVAVLIVIGYLYSKPLKPAKDLVQSKANNRGTGKVASSAERSNANINVDMVSTSAKSVIGAGLSAKINDLESQLKNASNDADKLSLQKQLAKQWDDVNQPAPAAFYYQAVARKENTAEDWINAGSRFNDAFKSSQDVAAQPVFDAGAVEAFQNAMKLKPESLDAKAGLGIAYVNGGGPPMQGIGLLLDVVKQDPTNRNAELNLGLFAMKSGQFEKAVDRFKTLIAQKPEVESYFYLAESYKQLGLKKEAIDAYQKCKDMMPDPTFDQRIDQYIKELKN